MTTNKKEPIIGYMNGRSGPSHNIHVLVTIEIPPDAITNLGRDGLIDPLFATYESYLFKIIQIVDEQLNKYSICTLDFENEHGVGDVFNNEDEEYTFYLSKKRVVHKMKSYRDIGYIVSYYSNGQKEEEYTLDSKRKKQGKYKSWSEDGALVIDCNYLNGKLDGEYKEWDEKSDEETEVDKDGTLPLVKHLLYSNGKKVEYLDKGLAIEKIDTIYEGRNEYIDNILSGLNPTMKFKKSRKNTVKSDKFKLLIEEIFDTIEKLNKIKSKDNEVIMYNNLKKIDLIKKLYDTFNTVYGKSYIDLYPDIKANAKEQIGYFITQFYNKPEQIYQEFKAYLVGIEQTLFI